MPPSDRDLCSDFTESTISAFKIAFSFFLTAASEHEDFSNYMSNRYEHIFYTR